MKKLILYLLGFIFIIYSFVLRIMKTNFSQFWFGIGIILIIYGIFSSKFKFPSKLKGVRKIIKIIFSFLILIFILIEIPIIYFGNKTYNGNCDYIIVLGAGLRGENMSLTLYQRVSKALQYAKSHKDTQIILSGGKGNSELISESQAMEKYFLENGISKQRVIKEDKSINTYQNLKFSYEKLEQISKSKNQDIGKLKIGVVTSNFHIFRAKFLGKRVGLNLVGIPSEVRDILKPNFYVREAFAVVKSAIFDR